MLSVGIVVLKKQKIKCYIFGNVEGPGRGMGVSGGAQVVIGITLCLKMCSAIVCWYLSFKKVHKIKFQSICRIIFNMVTSNSQQHYHARCNVQLDSCFL